MKPEAVLGKPAPCAPSQMARTTEETGPCRRDPSLQPQHAPAMSQKSSGHSPTQPRAGARLHMAGWGPAAHGPRQPAHTQQGHCPAGGAQQPGLLSRSLQGLEPHGPGRRWDSTAQPAGAARAGAQCSRESQGDGERQLSGSALTGPRSAHYSSPAGFHPMQESSSKDHQWVRSPLACQLRPHKLDKGSPWSRCTPRLARGAGPQT